MDIAKYIGLFLLKNNFCYLHGLGNLELKKKPAIYDGKMLYPSTCEVFVTSAGIIDDNLANFIASNEQTTISRATAELREFTADAKSDLHEGREVVIPFIGKLVEEYGRLLFITDPRLQFAAAPIEAKRSEAMVPEAIPVTMPVYEEPEYREPEQISPYAEPARRQRRRHREPEPEESGINWRKIIMTGLIIISLVAGAFYGIKLFRANDYIPSERLISQPIIDSSLLKPKTDTANSLMPASVTTDNNDVQVFRIVIENLSNKKKADKRALQMKSYGHDVEVVAKDSSSYLIILPIRCRPSDTTQVLDSLSNLFNPTGVSIYQ